ncbi:39S ribosomal protein L9, mitochondrial isoform X2 [Macrosteles quadrilineatus]|uniref:39S ribosomal protein L9, mitochondrial isoform X2 n=1 Tax=Macrosteles quadrilineatus TaxID=74068 RepID=UPI0023E1145D|nr:39S ribosomal protein L9, mitochondrial isoform X2 [Macrosteles quadrilineatus]
MLLLVRTFSRCVNFEDISCLRLKNYKRLINPLALGCFSFIPSRTTIIVKRPFPPTLYKEGNHVRLRNRTHYYDFVEDTNTRPDRLVNVVLSSYVEGIGNPGDLISMKISAAYNKLLVPGLADYATPEMIEYSKKIKADMELQASRVPVSVERSIKCLQRGKILVMMNQNNEWTIEPWHIRANARKCGIHILSEDSIELPPKPIKGPDMALQGKDFFITLKNYQDIK